MTQDENMRSKDSADLTALWQRQSLTARIPTPEEIRSRLSTLDRRTRMRNVIEYATAILGIIGALGLAALQWRLGVRGTGIFGVLLLAIGMVVVVHQLRARTGGPAIDGARPSIESYRALLRRERDALASAWLWYVGPMIPGMILLYGEALLNVKGNGLIFVGLAGAGTIVFVIWVIRINRRGARELDTELKLLDRGA